MTSACALATIVAREYTQASELGVCVFLHGKQRLKDIEETQAWRRDGIAALQLLKTGNGDSILREKSMMTNPTGASIQSVVSRILVATDFSLPAESALDWGRHLAAAFGAKLVLLHVIDIYGSAQIGAHMIGGNPLLDSLRKEAKHAMQELQARVPSTEATILEGSPRPAIVESAVELRCQMIVMGTHGRSGLAHLLMGSVAEYVVRHSKVPVLTVRA